MLVKTYACGSTSIDEKPIIWYVNTEESRPGYIRLSDVPILESVSHTMYGADVYLNAIKYPDNLTEEQFIKYEPIEQKLKTIQKIFDDIHVKIPFGKYQMDDVILRGLFSLGKHEKEAIDIQEILKAGLMVKAMVLLNQGEELPAYIEKIIDDYNAMELLKG